MKPKKQNFRFKEFTVNQEGAAMKVGTDGVLLGAWTNVSKANKILDIGSGSGLIALMLAQRSHAQITAVEIDASAATQAKDNFRNSPWSDRLSIHQQAIQDYAATPNLEFDLIVSNPPYFMNVAEITARSIARSQQLLTLEDLMRSANNLLNSTGQFSLVIPYDLEKAAVEFANEQGLYPHRILHVQGTPKSKIKRSLIAFGREQLPSKVESLIIEINSRHDYSEAYQELLKDYLIIF